MEKTLDSERTYSPEENNVLEHLITHKSQLIVKM